MIESNRTNELMGQTELDDFLNVEQATGEAEGYDGEGNLLNADYPPLQGDGSGESLPPMGEVDATEHTCDVSARLDEGISTPQTPADAAESELRLSHLATEIRTITEQTRATVISAALAVGKRLIEAKSICPAGRWLEWLETAVAYSERKAQDMMRLYLEYGRDGSIPDSIAALDYSKAVALLAAPAEAREALAEKAAGEGLSVRELQAEIKRLKAEQLKAQMKIDSYIAQVDRQRDEIVHLDEREQVYDRAIIERDQKLQAAEAAVEKEREAARLARAKASAAEASAEELRKLHSDAEDRAARSAQRASDAVNRANQVAKDLAEARAKIQALSEAAAASVPETQTVEVVPEAVQRELEQLKRDLAEARAMTDTPKASSERGGAPAGGGGVTATEKFKWFYANQMKPTFATALNLLREVAREDGKAASAFATALTNACKVLLNQLGTEN